MKEKVILAYSGGLDTTAIIPWLKETYNYDVVCVCADCGQEEELDGLEQRALSCGAAKLYIEDITDEFATTTSFHVFRHTLFMKINIYLVLQWQDLLLLRDLLRLPVRKVLLLSATVLLVRVMTRSDSNLQSRL